MLLPSKELLSEVCGKNVKDVELWENNIIRYFAPKDYILNIYELAHKCKEWAFDKGYTLTSGNNHLIFMSCSIRRTLTDDDWTNFYADTEPEAIFKACDYILEELSNE